MEIQTTLDGPVTILYWLCTYNKRIPIESGFPFCVSLQSKLPSDSKHCRAASFTDGFGCFLSVLHRYGLSIFAFFLRSALNTVHCHYLIHLLSNFERTKYITSSRHRMKLTVIRLLIMLCLVLMPKCSFAKRSALFLLFEPIVFWFEPIFICLLTSLSGDQLRVGLWWIIFSNISPWH